MLFVNLRLRLPALFLLLVSALSLHGQDEGVIVLRNASFEDMPRHSAPPTGWIDCGFPGESPPDIHPDPEFEFQVSKRAQSGNTYLGMVTRENETYESVGQRLQSPMAAGQCYDFRLQLARSEMYLSLSKRTRQPSNYVTPIVLRIWGGYSVCDRTQLLGQSTPVENYDWEEYRIKLKAEEAFTHIILEVYYKPQSMIPCNGNILLDNAQALVPMDCDEDINAPDDPADEPANPVVYGEPDQGIVTQPVVPRSVPPTTAPATAPDPTPEPEEPKVKLGKTETVLREGAVFAVEDISFNINSAELADESEESLQEIVNFLQTNPEVIVEIGGHANHRASSLYATQLSDSRAKAVVEYLKRFSIESNRLFARGYGKNKPVCREDSADCSRRNQRVEVKIVRLTRK